MRYPTRIRNKPASVFDPSPVISKQKSGGNNNKKKSNGNGNKKTSSKKTLHGDPYVVELSYASERGRIATVTKDSVETLNPRRYIDDVIVEVYFQELMSAMPRGDGVFGFVAPHFLYAQLSEDAGGPGNAMASELSEVFCNEVVFVPVIAGPDDNHWSLAIVIDGCAVIHADSLSHAGRGHGAQELLSPLIEHLSLIRGEAASIVPVADVAFPQQPNLHDCGLYMLKTVQTIVSAARSSVSSERASTSSIREFWLDFIAHGVEWFDHADVKTMRDEIYLMVGAPPQILDPPMSGARE